MCKSIKLLLLCIIISSYTSAYAAYTKDPVTGKWSTVQITSARLGSGQQSREAFKKPVEPEAVRQRELEQQRRKDGEARLNTARLRALEQQRRRGEEA